MNPQLHSKSLSFTINEKRQQKAPIPIPQLNSPPNSTSCLPNSIAMVENDQIRPLAPAGDRPNSDEDNTAALNLQKLRRRKFMKWCGCITTFLLLQIIVIVILIFTVLKVKDPIVTLNGIKFTKLEFNNTIPKLGANMSLIADVSVKNPNVASFRYSNTTTALYYHGTLVGEVRGPPGKAKARRTIRMNVTLDIITDRLISSPNLREDVETGRLTLSSYSSVPGKVKILNIIRRHVVVKMNCTFTANIASQAIQDQKCTRKVKL